VVDKSTGVHQNLVEPLAHNLPCLGVDVFAYPLHAAPSLEPPDLGVLNPLHQHRRVELDARPRTCVRYPCYQVLVNWSLLLEDVVGVMLLNFLASSSALLTRLPAPAVPLATKLVLLFFRLLQLVHLVLELVRLVDYPRVPGFLPNLRVVVQENRFAFFGELGLEGTQNIEIVSCPGVVHQIFRDIGVLLPL